MTELVDAAARTAAISERRRNVVVEASAGTGKTSVIVSRIVELVAPRGPSVPLPIERIAAITFTRKAAGELRVRTRQELLSELADSAADSPRAGLLRAALVGVDTASIGTIHGFADGLLRRWAMTARLDPHYELEEQDAVLARACFDQLVQRADEGSLPELLAGTAAAPRAAEVTATLAAVQVAGIRLYSYDGWHRSVPGVDSLVYDLITQRDVEVPDPPALELQRDQLERYTAELEELVAPLAADSPGARWLRELAQRARVACGLSAPEETYRDLVNHVERGPRGKAKDAPRWKLEFAGDTHAWNAWKAFAGDQRKCPVRERPLRDDLLAPLRRWLAMRLVRLRPVILALYERVKSQRQAVDHVDLLLKLRNLLRDDLVARGDCQALFDHVLVDEFQDTDPLQAEVVMFLCEEGARARTWSDVILGPGRLTIVGDPKQSIYRFRRADLESYRRVLERVGASPCLRVELVTSFRSTERLVTWLNARCAAMLGETERGPGGIAHRPLAGGRRSEVGAGAPVHALQLTESAGASFDTTRALEADALARYLRHLVMSGGVAITDRWTGRQRAIGYGDIAVLAMRTSNLPRLFAAFERDEVPFAARGGSLFLSDPMVQQFLRGLCAIADRDDGVATVGLLQPPFFALERDDLARYDRALPGGVVAAARQIIAEVRRWRFLRSPGATARALLEQTGFGRTAALGPNGRQRLASLYELCFQLDAQAAAQHLELDATMELVRAWLDVPAQLDPPHPVGADAVSVTTIHQAKGLEFPVVVLWDARGAWTDEGLRSAFVADREGRAWSLRLDGLTWDEPAGADLEAEERVLREAERRRLAYVAATRARDLLVVPAIAGDDARWMWASLLGTGYSSDPLVFCVPCHSRAEPAAWFTAAKSQPIAPGEITTRDGAITAALEGRWATAARERDRPVAFTDASSTRSWWGKSGRYGTAFGEVVHLAIAHVLRDGATPEAAVRRAMDQTRFRRYEDEATADVTRALHVLAAQGWLAPAIERRVEYPLACRMTDGTVRAGFADLIVCRAGDLIVIDFKTDHPPTSADAIEERYHAQIRGYAKAIEPLCEPAGTVAAGLLFTMDGSLHWERPPAHG